MARSSTEWAGNIGAFVRRDTDAKADNTAQKAALKSGAVLYAVRVNNASNAYDIYCKIYDDAAPTIGTTQPDAIFMVHASVDRTFLIPGGIKLTNNPSYSVSRSPGVTAGADPGAAVTIDLIYS